jgi:hypothetical protein
MGRGLTTVAEALADGGRVIWDPPDRPTLQVPSKWQEALSNSRDEVREVLHRAALFRQQANSKGGLPVLALPDAPLEDGFCVSCGGPKEGHYRCGTCRVAAWVALGWIGGQGQ